MPGANAAGDCHMRRSGSQPTFEAAVLVTDSKETKVAVRIQVQGHEVYAFRPLKGGPVKISFHASGQRHIQIGKGKHQLVRHDLPPYMLNGEESLFTTSFENFARLLPYKGEPFNAKETIDLTTFPASSIPFVEIAIGGSFASATNVHEPEYVETIVRETVVWDAAPAICIRVKYLSEIV
jgi:hypothetical protein